MNKNIQQILNEVEDEDWIYGDDVTHFAIKDGSLHAYCKKHNLRTRDVKLITCPPVDEICIYVKGKWSGYWEC